MNKIKVIDLLNKIANGEAPMTIFYMGATYDYDKEYMDYEDVDTGDLFFNDRYNTQVLNDEVETIEEEKEIEKLSIQRTWLDEFRNEPLLRYMYKEDIEDIENKINELIDIVKELKNEKENK